MTYDKYLIDDIGERRERKNQYILDSIKAEESGGPKIDPCLLYTSDAADE